MLCFVSFVGCLCSTNLAGGAVRFYLSSASLSDVRFESNEAQEGGALSAEQSAITATDVVFSGNSATGEGGAMNLFTTTMYAVRAVGEVASG